MDELEFLCQLQNFKNEGNKMPGKFTGILVNMQSTQPAKGFYRFKKGSMKNNDGKKIFLMYNHLEGAMPIGTLVGKETEKGFEVEGQFHLEKDENGNYINPEAVKLYSFMKDMGMKFEMSVGGSATKFSEVIEDGKLYIDILEFNAIEGSLTPKGAVSGSKVNKVFNDHDGGQKMDKKELELLLATILGNFKEEMLNAANDKEIKALPEKFAELTTKFAEVKEELDKNFKEEFNTKLAEINEVVKSLKADFKPTEKEVTLAEEFAALLNMAEKRGIGAGEVITSDTVLEFADAASTTANKGAVKSTYVTKILERVQALNPVLQDIRFIPITDGSATIPREVAGLPEVGWVGEAGERETTSSTSVEPVMIQINQLYALPSITNKLLASNFVGYAAFLMRRTEYALSLKLADAVFSGTGVNMPLGILKDSAITQKQEIDATDDSTFVDSLIDIYYSIPSVIAGTCKWYMTRNTWATIVKLKNSRKDFYITDLNNGASRTLMTRPVELIESSDAGFKDISKAGAEEIVVVFGNLSDGILGIQNDQMTVRLEDRLTSKGVTKYYIEKGVGLGVQLPENFVKVTKKQ